MSTVFNTVFYGVGKIKNTDALLSVYVLTGATVSISKNGLSITPTIWTENSSNTIDCALFVIPQSTFDDTAWSVSASVGGKSASSTIIIDSAKEYDINLVQELSKLYLYKSNPIDNCVDVTRAWTAVDMRYTSTSGATRHTPTVGTSGEYTTLTNGQTTTYTTEVWMGAYVAGNSSSGMATDLTGYTKLTLEYDLTLSGNANSNRKFLISLFASKVWIWESWYQTDATSRGSGAINTSIYQANQTFSDQKLSINLSGGEYVQVGIGVNQNYNPGVRGVLKIKALYAEP